MIKHAGEIQRQPLRDVLATWFAVDRTAVVDSVERPTLILPRQAATLSSYWVQRTTRATTMSQWRAVFRDWKALCPQGLLLGPHLWDLDDPEDLEWNDPPGPLPDDAPFSVTDGGLYDVQSGPGFTIQPQLAQDAWVPREWAEEFGEPDEGFGMDYEPAEFIYPSLERLLSKLNAHSIGIVEASHLVWSVWDPSVQASDAADAWEPVVVDEYGNPSSNQ